MVLNALLVTHIPGAPSVVPLVWRSASRACLKRPSAKKMTREEFLARPVDEEWERARRKESEDLKRRQREEDEGEVRQALEYRRIGEHLRNYPVDDVNKARKLVATLIQSGEEVEKLVMEAAHKAELTPLVLLVIQTRLDIARQDTERDAIEALDLLHRRIEYEMMKRESSPAMQLLNELLNMYDGTDEDEWKESCRLAMLKAFPPEGAFTILSPIGFDLSKHTGPIDAPPEGDDPLLRIDFIREVDQLITEVEEKLQPETIKGLDPDAVALRLKQEEKRRTLELVKNVRNLAITLKW